MRPIHPEVIGSLFKGEARVLQALVGLADDERNVNVPEGTLLLDILNPRVMYERPTLNTYIWNLRKKGYITVASRDGVKGRPIKQVRINRSAFMAPGTEGPSITELMLEVAEATRMLAELIAEQQQQ
jgi:hypothetical protein